jgi:ABC-2 type transport system permease protein
MTPRSWRIVAAGELRDLWWGGGRGPTLLFAHSILLSVITYLAATNQVLNFLEQREAVSLTLSVSVAVAVLVTLIVSADSISGERERGTLEAILLAPVSRQAIVAGKLLAAMSLWLGAYVVTLPYVWVLGRGVGVVSQAALVGLLAGTVTALAVATIGLVISALSRSNRLSLSVCLLLLLALFAPTQLPTGPTGAFGSALARINPIDSALRYLSSVLVAGHAWPHEAPLLVSPLAVAVLGLALLGFLADRLVVLTPGRSS